MRINYSSPLPRKKENTYILGVSGGPDSIFLLQKMSMNNYKFVVAHVNYCKRMDSDCDEELVRSYCQKLNIDLFTLKANACPSGNFQNYARNVRYDFFIRIATRLENEGSQIGGIVIAHNFEDLLETYELQNERNSFVNKWGLASHTKIRDFSIWRPILSYRKEYIINRLKKWNINYNSDSTNFLNIYRRNIVRSWISKLTETGKDNLFQNIIKKNFLLDLKKKEVEIKLSLIVDKQFLFIGNEEWKNSDLDVQAQIIYIWINKFCSNKFISPKKNVLKEIHKQLSSNKKIIMFKIGKGIKIEKKSEIATLIREE